jgi:hypothetical protein
MNLGLVAFLFQVPSPSAPQATPPFAVGEILEYSARYGMLRPGTARLAVVKVDTVRGVPSWVFSFTFEVSLLRLYSNRSELTSWTGQSDFVSRRFLKEIEEKGKRRVEDFAIFPDSGFYRRGSDTLTHPASAAPIDDVAFFYFIRTTPLVVGQTYTYDSYYRKAVNPVSITVLKRERMTLPDGSKRECLVIRPVVEDRNGMFAKRAKARIWLTDDAQRLPVQIESTYSFGTVKLVLSRITLGRGQ